MSANIYTRGRITGLNQYLKIGKTDSILANVHVQAK